MKRKNNDICEVTCIHKEAVERVKKEIINNKEVSDLAATFKVMGEPSRVRIIQALSLSELCVCDLAAVLNMSNSAVSHQLRLLRNLRLVKYRKEGKIVYYSLDDEHIINLFNEGLVHIRHK